MISSTMWVTARFQSPFRQWRLPTPTMASADFCLITPHVAMQSAVFRPHARQISPDKNVNFRYTTAAFTLSPESRASSCGADLPGDWALYAVSVRRLIALHSGLAAPFGRFRLRLTFRFASLRLQTFPHGNAFAVG
jgi:hypothetical protein